MFDNGEQFFTKEIHQYVQKLTQPDKDGSSSSHSFKLYTLDEYSKNRVRGYLRMILYCHYIKGIPGSKDITDGFPEETYDTSYEKDLFLHGMPKINFDEFLRDGFTKTEKEALLEFFTNNKNKDDFIGELSYLSRMEDDPERELPYNCNSRSEGIIKLDSDGVFEFLIMKPLKGEKLPGIGLIPKVLTDTLPVIVIDGEEYPVPVVEFRAPYGNGCTLEDLHSVLVEQHETAYNFARQGYNNHPTPPGTQSTRKKQKIDLQ